MDKLEKALLKARQERAELLQGSASKKPAAKAGASASNLPAPTVEIERAVLEENRIIAHQSKSVEADLFRILRTQILQTMSKNGFRTLAITSPNYGDGKTTIAVNLAISIALDLNQTILLADLDLRKPSAHAYLGLAPSKGLTNYLAGKAELPDCLLRMPFERMTFLPAGGGLDHSSEVLGSPQMGALASELKERYADRIIIYDMPPLLAQDDPLTFLPHVDAVLLVIKDSETAIADVKRSLDILSSANVIGTVLNDHVTLAPFLKRRGKA